MDELKTRLKTIERLEPPDLWRRIETGQRRPVATGAGHSKSVAVVVSFVVFAAAISGLWYAFSRPGEQPNVPTAPATAALVRVATVGGKTTATLIVGSAVQSAEVDRCPLGIAGCITIVPRVTTPLIDIPAGASLHVEGWRFRRLGWCATQPQYKGILCGGDFTTNSIRPVPRQLPMDPGTYVIQLEGVQNGVDLSVYFSVRIVGANRVAVIHQQIFEAEKQYTQDEENNAPQSQMDADMQRLHSLLIHLCHADPSSDKRDC